ncbi:hypothetical protein AVEN_264881-1 [Araneus ventricosus]|uniref:Uncharacterized protein n=1 Tax=Araneus ventricosus TaxID=182803 RepID=A0A4Y2IPX9_ARAVE|nr:hypothetical protein AVEN_264881-1 [Araneus ventricosus]
MSSLGFGAGGSQVRNPIPLKILGVWLLLHIKSYVMGKRPPAGMVRKFGEDVSAEVTSFSTDRGSKFRGPSLNYPLVA